MKKGSIFLKQKKMKKTFNPPKNNFFTPLAYYLDYYNMDNKFIGSLKLEEPVSDKIGFYSKTYITPKHNITLDNKKVIKAGTDVYYKQEQLQGKLILKNI